MPDTSKPQPEFDVEAELKKLGINSAPKEKAPYKVETLQEGGIGGGTMRVTMPKDELVFITNCVVICAAIASVDTMLKDCVISKESYATSLGLLLELNNKLVAEGTEHAKTREHVDPSEIQ